MMNCLKQTWLLFHAIQILVTAQPLFHFDSPIGHQPPKNKILNRPSNLSNKKSCTISELIKSYFTVTYILRIKVHRIFLQVDTIQSIKPIVNFSLYFCGLAFVATYYRIFSLL